MIKKIKKLIFLFVIGGLVVSSIHTANQESSSPKKDTHLILTVSTVSPNDLPYSP